MSEKIDTEQPLTSDEQKEVVGILRNQAILGAPLVDRIAATFSRVEQAEARIRELEHDVDLLMQELPDSMAVRLRVATKMLSLGTPAHAPKEGGVT